MEKENLFKLISIIAIIGVLFSSYLSFGTIITGACPLNGECPFFLGYPACNYGLVMFCIILITALFTFKQGQNIKNLIKYIVFVSFIGILFSGYFSMIEILNPRSFALFLPTCVYGLIMYLLIFILSFNQINKN